MAHRGLPFRRPTLMAGMAPQTDGNGDTMDPTERAITGGPHFSNTYQGRVAARIHEETRHAPDGRPHNRNSADNSGGTVPFTRPIAPPTPLSAFHHHSNVGGFSSLGHRISSSSTDRSRQSSLRGNNNRTAGGGGGGGGSGVRHNSNNGDTNQHASILTDSDQGWTDADDEGEDNEDARHFPASANDPRTGHNGNITGTNNTKKKGSGGGGGNRRNSVDRQDANTDTHNNATTTTTNNNNNNAGTNNHSDINQDTRPSLASAIRDAVQPRSALFTPTYTTYSEQRPARRQANANTPVTPRQSQQVSQNMSRSNELQDVDEPDEVPQIMIRCNDGKLRAKHTGEWDPLPQSSLCENQTMCAEYMQRQLSFKASNRSLRTAICGKRKRDERPRASQETSLSGDEYSGNDSNTGIRSPGRGFRSDDAASLAADGVVVPDEVQGIEGDSHSSDANVSVKLTEEDVLRVALSDPFSLVTMGNVGSREVLPISTPFDQVQNLLVSRSSGISEPIYCAMIAKFFNEHVLAPYNESMMAKNIEIIKSIEQGVIGKNCVDQTTVIPSGPNINNLSDTPHPFSSSSSSSPSNSTLSQSLGSSLATASTPVTPRRATRHFIPIDYYVEDELTQERVQIHIAAKTGKLMKHHKQLLKKRGIRPPWTSREVIMFRKNMFNPIIDTENMAMRYKALADILYKNELIYEHNNECYGSGATQKRLNFTNFKAMTKCDEMYMRACASKSWLSPYSNKTTAANMGCSSFVKLAIDNLSKEIVEETYVQPVSRTLVASPQLDSSTPSVSGQQSKQQQPSAKAISSERDGSTQGVKVVAKQSMTFNGVTHIGETSTTGKVVSVATQNWVSNAAKRRRIGIAPSKPVWFSNNVAVNQFM